MAIKARFPLLLLLLGIVLLALVCVSSGVRHPCHEKCLKRCNRVNEASESQECRSRCEGWPERCEEEEQQEEEDERPWHKQRGRRERGRQEGEREEEERQHPGRRERGRQEGEREEEERQHRQPRHHEEEEGQQQRPEKWQQRREREEVGQWQTREEREERQHPQSRHQEEGEGQQQQRPEQRQQRHEREEEEEWQARREREQEERQHRQPRRQEEEEGEQQRHRQRQPRHEREQEEQERPKHRRPRHEEEREEEKGEWRGRRRHEDPDERERVIIRRERRQEQEERGQIRGHHESEEGGSSSSESQRRRRHRESEEEDEGSSSSESQRRGNPFYFSSNRFQTLFENENGRIRLLQRFDKRSNLFQNLKNYRLLEYRSKPRTLLLPQHIDADSILVVLSGRAIFTVVNPNDRNSFNLERGDAIRLPAGTTAYLANRDDNEDLRVVDLAIPINRPGQFQSFFPSSSQNQQSYFNEFSGDILEASFNTNYKEIERVLLEDEQERRQQRRERRERQQSQEANPIVKVSREQIEELRRNAKSSSKKSSSSESQPFNLRSQDPVYSNKFGRFFEITPEKNPQLQNLSLSISSVEIREGAIMLPHYNSRAFVILVVNEGKGHVELVGQRNEQQQQRRQQQREEDEQEQEEEERSIQLQRYRARLSSGDVFVIPASNPVAINASSDLNFIEFGINAENNQRNFLAGEEDNVISQIHRPVKELAFPGSAQEVERLIKNQRQSHFASAQPQQREEESQKRRGPLSSILEAFY